MRLLPTLAANGIAAAFLCMSPCGRALAEGGGDAGLKDLLVDILGIKNVRGHVKAESVTYWTLPPVTNVDCGLRITKEGDWHFENMRADTCGGRMTGDASIYFGNTGRKFDIKANFVGVRLEDVTRHTKRPVTPGVVSATAELQVTSEGRNGLSGDVAIQLRDGNLGRFPMVLKALSLLSFPGLEKETIENADARMTLTPRAIVFRDLSLSSTDGGFQLVAERHSWVGYGGDLDLYFRPVIESRFLERVPAVGEVVNRMIDDIQQRGMRIRVTGDSSSPRFQWAAFSVRGN